MRTIAAALLIFATTSTAAAQDPASPAAPAPMPARGTVGIDGALVVPLGNYADGVNVAAGALLRLEWPVGRGFVTGRAGVLVHAVKENAASLVLAPVYAGYRYPVGTRGLYVAGELGITIGHASVDTGFGSASETDTELGITLGVGVRRGSLDLRGALFMPDADDLVGIMGTVGFDFAGL